MEPRTRDLQSLERPPQIDVRIRWGTAAQAPARPNGENRPGNKTNVQEFGRAELSCEEIIEQVIFGSLRSLRPLKEGHRALAEKAPHGISSDRGLHGAWSSYCGT
jgi:hypothetical protein